MIALATYVPRLRRMIQDKGGIEHQEFVGDGASRDFYLLYTPIESGTETVYVNDVETTAYSLDVATGRLRLGTAPADTVLIRVIYKVYVFDEETLVEYLEDSIEECNDRIGKAFALTGASPSTMVDPSPSNIERRLILLLSIKNLKRDDAATNSTNYMYRMADVTVNRVNVVRDAIENKKELDKDIDKLVFNIIWNDPQHDVALSGGDVPLGIGIGDDCDITETGPNLYLGDLL